MEAAGKRWNIYFFTLSAPKLRNLVRKSEMHVNVCSESQSKDICQGGSTSLAWKKKTPDTNAVVLVQSASPLKENPNPDFGEKPISPLIGFQFTAQRTDVLPRLGLAGCVGPDRCQ